MTTILAEVSVREAGIRPSSEPGPERPGTEGAESGQHTRRLHLRNNV